MHRASIVTGAAGFIGSNQVDRLLEDDRNVVRFDNFSTGRAESLNLASRLRTSGRNGANLLDLPQLTRAMAGCDFVFHLAANADVRFGLEHPRKDLDQNADATWNALEAMRANGIRRIVFIHRFSLRSAAGLSHA